MNLAALFRFALDGYRAYNGDTDAAKRVIGTVVSKVGPIVLPK